MEKEAGSAQGWTDRHWVSADGLRLAFRDYAGPADRPPILCLHGLTRNARDFVDFAGRHAGQWRLLLPDFRGRGASQWDNQPERYKPPVYAADILQLLDELNIQEAIFVGTSLGGIVTMQIAAIAPHRIAATVLNDIGPMLDPSGLERIGDYVGRPVRFRDWEDVAQALTAHQSSTHPDYETADWERYARRICRERDGAIEYDYDMAIVDNFRLSQGAPAIDAWPYFRALSGAPLLIVRGELSDLLSASVAQQMVRAHPDAELVTVPNVGHPPDLDEPDAQAGIERLLQRARRIKK
ncbi:MAG: alpha/beta hydrolase [Sphingomonas sp.]|nr:alpha/beta hydrolase [Sphingomonas sp.]